LDHRVNPRITNQNFVEMRYIDNESLQRELRNFVKNKFSVYAFCGQEHYCTLNVDADPRSKANLIMEVLTFLESLQDNSIDVFIFDPLFVFIDDEALDSEGKIKDGFYNANSKAWEKAMRKYGLSEEIIAQAKKSPLFGHNMELQRTIFKKVKPGGVAISKRGMANCNTMSKLPQLYYVYDSRPSAHIVRFDWKESDQDESDLKRRTRI
jgi:hypothetical protein